MNFLFWPFLWFGLPGRLLSHFWVTLVSFERLLGHIGSTGVTFRFPEVFRAHGALAASRQTTSQVSEGEVFKAVPLEAAKASASKLWAVKFSSSSCCL